MLSYVTQFTCHFRLRYQIQADRSWWKVFKLSRLDLELALKRFQSTGLGNISLLSVSSPVILEVVPTEHCWLLPLFFSEEVGLKRMETVLGTVNRFKVEIFI